MSNRHNYFNFKPYRTQYSTKNSYAIKIQKFAEIEKKILDSSIKK